MRRLASIVPALALAACFGTAHAQVTIHLTTTQQTTCDVHTDASGLRLGANGTDLTATGVTLSGTGCGGGGGAPTPNNFPLVVLPAAPISGVPFTVSWAVTGATTCTGSASLNGNSANLSGWTDVTTASSPRTVNATASGTYTLSLTCSNASGSVTSAPATVVVAQGTGGDACPASPRTRATSSDIHYLPEPPAHVRHGVDITAWENIWGAITENDDIILWPGRSGASPTVWSLGKTQYIAAKFRTGAFSSSIAGTYTDVSYGAGPNIDMAISQTCGDFAPAPGCVKTNIASQDQALVAWNMTSNDNFHCKLLPNTDYYTNVQFHNPTATGPGCTGDFCKITIQQNFHN